jgi:hypothetical protein
MVGEIKKPLIVYGSGDEKKDAEVLPKVAQVCAGENLLIGPVQKENFEVVGKAILDNGHVAIAQSPLDINLLKELNVKLCKFLPPERVIIDPLSSALGYGIEYSFSLIERVKQIGIITKKDIGYRLRQSEPIWRRRPIDNIPSICPHDDRSCDSIPRHWYQGSIITYDRMRYKWNSGNEYQRIGRNYYKIGSDAINIFIGRIVF